MCVLVPPACLSLWFVDQPMCAGETYQVAVRVFRLFLIASFLKDDGREPLFSERAAGQPDGRMPENYRELMRI